MDLNGSQSDMTLSCDLQKCNTIIVKADIDEVPAKRIASTACKLRRALRAFAQICLSDFEVWVFTNNLNKTKH